MERVLTKVCLLLSLNLNLFVCGIDLAGAAEQHAAEPVLSLPVLVQEAMENSPEIRAVKQRWEAARAIIPQAGTLPDPLITGGYMSRGSLASEPVTIWGVMQEVPFPGKLQLREDMASREAERMQADYAAVRFRVIARLKEAYFDLHLVHKALEIVEKNKGLLQDFEKTAKARYAVGKVAQQDVFRAQVELSRVLDRLAVLEQRRESLHAEIEEGAASTVLVHLANISYRLGRTLHFDPETMSCKGDAEANRMFTRNYRTGFVVPKMA